MAARARRARGGERLGPASWVTLARATLAVGVAALAADSFTHDTPVALLVALAAVALALDAADGWVARRTGTATALGARFDGEVDAFLILALSVYVAPRVRRVGARDRRSRATLFLAGEWLLPWMRAPLPRRRWRRVVAAAQGVVLTVAAAERPAPRAHAGPPRRRARLARRPRWASACGGCGAAAPPRPARRGRRRGAQRRSPCCSSGPRSSRRTSRAASTSAGSRGSRSSSSSSSPWPRCCPPTPRRVLAVVAGAVLSVLVRREGPRHRLLHRVRPAVQARRRLELRGHRHRDAARRDRQLDARTSPSSARRVLSLALLAVPVLALLRVTRVAAGHRGWALRAAAVLGVVWVVLRVAGAPVASSSAAALAVDEVQAVRAGLHDRAALARELAHDRFRATPGDRLLTGLRGKDVLLVFVESYGRVAVQGSSFSPRHRRACSTRATQQLRAAGFAARSAFLTSPTFGGLSWLAHSTLQSGRPGRRPAALRPARRQRPPHAHARRSSAPAGGRSARCRPTTAAWPEGKSFYRYDAVYDRRNVGYRGPRLRPAADARPVHAGGLPAARARRAPTGRRCSPRST